MSSRYAFHVRQITHPGPQPVAPTVAIFAAGGTQPHVVLTVEQAEYVASCLSAWASTARSVYDIPEGQP